MKLLPFLIVTTLLMFTSSPAISAIRPDGLPNRAEWMAKGSFGVMTHYLIQPKGATSAAKTADLNRIVNAFDLDGYIRQIQETGADWVIFTLGQTTGYLCSPNAYLDKLAPGMTPRRDLALELGRRLHKIGKKLILYLPSAESADPAIKAALKAGTAGYESRYFNFLREYSVHLGKLCDGWWFDACSTHPDNYWLEWIAALRSGNPNSIIAFSGAEFCCGSSVQPISRLADYTAGEIHLLEDGRIRRDFLPPGGDLFVKNGKLRLRGREAQTYMPDSQFINNVQWHGLLPLDLSFNPAIPNQFSRYPDNELFAFVGAVKSVGGAVTINVPVDMPSGLIYSDSHAQLVRLGKWLRGQLGKR